MKYLFVTACVLILLIACTKNDSSVAVSSTLVKTVVSKTPLRYSSTNFTYDNLKRVILISQISIDSSVTPMKFDTLNTIYKYTDTFMQPTSYTDQHIIETVKYTFSHLLYYDNLGRPILDSINTSVPTYNPGLYSGTYVTDIKHISYGSDKIMRLNRKYPYRATAAEICVDTFYLANQNVMKLATNSIYSYNHVLGPFTIIVNTYSYTTYSNPLYGINTTGITLGESVSKNLPLSVTTSFIPNNTFTFQYVFDAAGLVKTATSLNSAGSTIATSEYFYY